jgi:anti-sigma regulatory factor (Ser/Thr protein kinase)
MLHPIRVDEDVGALRRAVARTAVGQSGLRHGEAELVATELGTNLIRHARPGGYVLYRRAGHGIEVLSVDHGPGITPAGMRALKAQPGPESPPPFLVGGLTAGLAGIQRFATDFDCYSTPRGTVILARLGTTPAAAGGWRYGAVNTPLRGEESGDAWAVAPGPRPTALVVDGLGHGAAAAAAAHAAITEFDRHPADVGDFMRRAHEVMRGTRGGVLGMCVIDPRSGELTYAGVGNITGHVLHGGKTQHLLGRPGTLGTHLAPPSTHLQRCRWEAGATLVLVSDGIHSGWDLAGYPDLLDHDPAVVAAVLHRDHGRTTDDATVLVVHEMANAT